MHYLPYFDFRITRDKNRLFEYYVFNISGIITYSIMALFTSFIDIDFQIKSLIIRYFIYFGFFHILNLYVYRDKYLNKESIYYIANSDNDILHPEKCKHIKYILIITYIWLSFSTLIFHLTFIFDVIKKLYYKQNYTFSEYYRFFYLKFPYVIMSIVLNGYYKCEADDINILCEFRYKFIDSNLELKSIDSKNLKSMLLLDDQYLYLIKNTDMAFYSLIIIKKNKINVLVHKK